MTRRSNRKAARVSYVELLGEQPEPEPEASSSARRAGKRKAAEDSDFEHPDAPEEEEEESIDEDAAESTFPVPVSVVGFEDQTNTTTQRSSNPRPKSAPKSTRRSKEANARARPCPAFFPDPAVRLQQATGLFEAQKLVEEPGQRDAVSTKKARDNLGLNIGAGPALDLCEDFGWFKEGSGRPIVYEDVRIKEGDFTVIDAGDAVQYIYGGNPTGLDTVACLMGPFGSQQPAQFKLFEAHKLEQYWPTSRALAFNTGNPVWGLDWCPVSEEFAADHEYAQYLAVSTIPRSPPHTQSSEDTDDSTPTLQKSAIQLWRFGPSTSPTNKADLGTASCALIMCLDDLGPARVLKWCPLPTNDKDKDGKLRKLGILAGVFGDGSVTVYAVPDPRPVGAVTHEGREEPMYVRLARPLVRLALPDTRFTCLDWANSETIAVGCSNGHVAVYNVKSAIQGKEHPQGLPPLPTHYIPVHQSRVQTVNWVRLPTEPNQPDLARDEGPHLVISGGFDGHVYVTDLRHPGGMPVSMYRCRDVIQSVAFTSYGAGIISNEHENIIKFTGLHPLVLGRGHNVTEARGPIWDIATSDLHPQVAITSSDGTLAIANLLKYVRKGSLMPSFVHTVYRMDFNRQTNELRMLDMLVPRDHKDPRNPNKTREPPQGIATASQRAAIERKRDGFGAWEPQIGIHCAAWQPTRLAQAGVLASGGASGLVRIDVLRDQVFGLKPQDGGPLEGGEEEDELDDD